MALASKFGSMDWTRFDVDSIVTRRGIATVDRSCRDSAMTWLAAQHYTIRELDFGAGISRVVARFSDIFEWEAQFGYRLEPTSRNLDALWDGFDIEIPVDGGFVFWLRNLGVAIEEDARWSRGFCQILSEYSLAQLAIGKRFFAAVEVDGDDVAIGWKFEDVAIGPPVFSIPRRDESWPGSQVEVKEGDS